MMYFVTWFILQDGLWVRMFAAEWSEEKAYRFADDLSMSGSARGIKVFKGFEIGI